MQYRQEFEWGAEEHCYFPEWADRPEAPGSLHELDRNSYLAGGYAEEFGHRAPAAAVGRLSLPIEEDGEWRVQTGGLHPGYPECPRPLDRASLDARRDSLLDNRARSPLAASPRPSSAGFRVVLVGRDSTPRGRHGAWIPWKALWIRRSKLPLG